MAAIKFKGTLPNNETMSLSFPNRATVEQVKNKFLENVPPRLRKEPHYIVVDGVVLDLEFYKVLDAHPNIADAVEQGAEIEITFMTQLEAKRKMQKGELTNVKPQAKTVSKAFVQQVKEKEATITLTAEEKAAFEEKKRQERDAEEQKRREEEEKKREEARLKDNILSKTKETEAEIAAIEARLAASRKDAEAADAAAEVEFQAKLASVNAEWDAKIAAVVATDKSEQDAHDAKVADLRKIGS